MLPDPLLVKENLFPDTTGANTRVPPIPGHNPFPSCGGQDLELMTSHMQNWSTRPSIPTGVVSGGAIPCFGTFKEIKHPPESVESDNLMQAPAVAVAYPSEPKNSVQPILPVVQSFTPPTSRSPRKGISPRRVVLMPVARTAGRWGVSGGKVNTGAESGLLVAGNGSGDIRSKAVDHKKVDGGVSDVTGQGGVSDVTGQGGVEDVSHKYKVQPSLLPSCACEPISSFFETPSISSSAYLIVHVVHIAL